MANTKVEIYLDGDNAGAVKELHDIELLATFENGNAQGNISITEFEFINEYAEKINSWIQNGTTGGVGIFEGIPMQVQVTGESPTYIAFDGYLDMTDEFGVVNPTTSKGKIKKDSSLQNLDDLASGLTFYFLVEEGVLTLSQMEWVPYIIERKFDPIAFLLMILTIYSVTTQLIDLIKELAEQASSGITAPILFALQIVYALALAVYLVSLLIDFIRMIVEPIKYTRGVRLKTLLEVGSNYLGYTYNTSISEIYNDNIILIPSKNSVDETGNGNKQRSGILIFNNGLGIPNARDFGYTLGEIYQLVNKTFNAKIGIKNGIIEQHSLNSSWWIQQSTYQMPEILLESRKYNTDDLSSNFLLTFTPDPMDKNVMENYKGTSYEVVTTPISVINQKNVTLKGLNEIEIPYALGIRKNRRTIIESLLDTLQDAINPLLDLINSVGTPQTTPVPTIANRKGCVKFETDFLNVPKMLYMNRITHPSSPTQLPSNYHSLWSAKVLWNKYYKQTSFVGDPPFQNTNQWIIHEGVRIPFGFEDFLTLVDNSYFYDKDGNVAQITKIQWNVSQDYAVVDYRINKVYTTNLQETYIEVGGDDATGENFD